MKEKLIIFFKGFIMGAANVVPGVSGGTIALVTGVFERLINSLKSFDIKALRLLKEKKFSDFSKHTDLSFLTTIFAGAIVSIMTMAKLLEFLFTNYPVFIWSYFFGLILASVYFVGKQVKRVSPSVISVFLIGFFIAIAITILKPAQENTNILYLFLCGIVGVSSMILPGLSGSFILILMGNYHLIMIKAVNGATDILRGNFEQFLFTIKIITPVAIGVIIGLLAFSRLLAWIYKKYRSQTIASLTGFILGSLNILWPWKNSFDQNSLLIQTNRYGAFLSSQKIKIYYYEHFLPEINTIFFVSIFLMFIGLGTILFVEKVETHLKGRKI